MGRRVWISVAALLVLLPVADTILWRLAVQRLEVRYDEWTRKEKAAGWDVTGGRRVTGGWPLAATLTMTDFAVRGADQVIRGGVEWHSPYMTLRIGIVKPNVLELEARGQQRLRVGNGQETTVTAERLLGVVGLDTGTAPSSSDVLAEKLSAAVPLGWDPPWAASAEQFHCHLEMSPDAGQGEAALVFSVKADRLNLPSGIKWPLGSSIAFLAVEGELEGPVPAQEDLAAWATAWRDGGGSLVFRQLAINWGPLDVSASATLALDDQLQPMGAGNSRLIGYAAALDALAGSGGLSHSAVTAAKAVLSLLAGTPADGEHPDVDVPLTLQYRTLSMRQVPLLRLPELDWQGQ